MADSAIDDNIINLFRVIREHSYELVRLIECTPYAKAEYECCRRTYKTETDDIDGWDKQSIRVQTNAGHTNTECLYISPICSREINLF